MKQKRSCVGRCVNAFPTPVAGSLRSQRSRARTCVRRGVFASIERAIDAICAGAMFVACILLFRAAMTGNPPGVKEHHNGVGSEEAQRADTNCSILV